MEAIKIKFIFTLMLIILIFSSFAIAQDVNHNANDNVCCIDNQGACLKNIPSENANNFQRCFENEDCYVPECTLGCCKSETDTIRTCSFTTARACIGSTFYENVKLEACEALCREGPLQCGDGVCGSTESALTCPRDCNQEASGLCNPVGLQEINIREASGGRFDHIDSMYYNGSDYLFFISNSYFTLSNNPLERKLKGPFRFSMLGRTDLKDLFEGFGDIDEFLVTEKLNINPEVESELFFMFKDNEYITLEKSTRIDRPGLKPFLNSIFHEISGDNGLLSSMESFLVTSREKNLPPTPFNKVDAALLYKHKYYFIEGNKVYTYKPRDYRGSRTRWSGEEALLSDLIPGCNSIDSIMYDGNNIYISKGGKAWIIPLIERQETANLPKVESLNLDFKDGQALCSVKGTADSNTQLLVQFRYLVNGGVVSSFGSPIAAEFFRQGLTANYESINNLINEFNQGNIFSGVNPEIVFQGVRIQDELSIECDVIPYRINNDGTIKIDDAVIRVKSTPLVFRRNAVARFFANIFRRGPGAP